MTEKLFLSKSKIILLSLGFIYLEAIPAFAQASRLNFGLSQKQDPSTLPVSLVKPKQQLRKPKVNIQPVLQKTAENEYLLSSGWEMEEADKVTT